MAPPFSDEVQGWAPELGAALQAELGETGEFDPHSLVVRGAYAERGGAVYGEAEMPRSGDSRPTPTSTSASAPTTPC